ncbi:hypothetical protein [uncultured Acetatifactor sp.]|uniref:hypothetical protein n=1 Tax=uncultured Acetatifactor sp. TaxID=1671927 RepID=UPI00261FFC96|nr:hypothetical protein [uncultured Acetatifactor sp.]
MGKEGWGKVNIKCSGALFLKAPEHFVFQGNCWNLLEKESCAMLRIVQDMCCPHRRQGGKGWGRKKYGRDIIRENLQVYGLMLPTILLILIFCYIPMYGIIIAFQDHEYFTLRELSIFRIDSPVTRIDPIKNLWSVLNDSQVSPVESCLERLSPILRKGTNIMAPKSM